MKALIRKVLKKGLVAIGMDGARVSNKSIHSKVMSLTPPIASKGSVLLAYVIEPFLLRNGEQISNEHSHDWESYQIANTFLEMGYCVDAISYLNRRFIPEKNYDIFVAARTSFDRIASLLNKDCIKIVHLDTAHWLYNNHAAYGRLMDVVDRRGVALDSVRFIERNWAIENADCATVLGNRFTMDTYRYAGKRMYQVPVSVPVVYDWPDNKDFDICRKNFLWFGSAGFVHKGLDLVLEAFSEMPDLNLTVCGPIEEDDRFRNAYNKELYQTGNIRTHGWVDVGSKDFIDIAASCIALVYPSCAEGGGSSVLTCMHAGLIPIISYESSVDIDDTGVILASISKDEIKQQVRRISEMPALQCKDIARRAWESARKRHTREIFATAYNNTIREILTAYSESG